VLREDASLPHDTSAGKKWEVVGGGEKGGIIVRTGKELTSAQGVERLSLGSTITCEELAGDRLRYSRITGSGPVTGWVSLSVGGKPLVRRVHDADLGARGRRAGDPDVPAAVGPPHAEREGGRMRTAVRLETQQPELSACPSKMSGSSAAEPPAFPEVPDLEEVLASLAQDEREEGELEALAAERADFFNLSAPSTVSKPSTTQWWEPALRLDGPEFSMKDAATVGLYEHAKDTRGVQPDGSGPPRPTAAPLQAAAFQAQPSSLEGRLARTAMKQPRARQNQ